MSALDRKLLRDLYRLWAQGLAVALVMACGVMTIVVAVGAYRSLLATREAYYERYSFARVNRLVVRTGRLPQPERPEEVAVNEDFALAHGFRVGDEFSAILNGRKERLRITGTVLSPEFIYSFGPGDIVPDPRRFAILYMTQHVLAPLFDREGAFNDLVLRLLPEANEVVVITAVDRLLRPFGGTTAYGRKDHLSHAFLDAELTELSAMARIIPPIFLIVSAFLINIVLSRLIALEREQIGLLKALGYFSRTIAWHYAKLVIAISAVGIAIGSVAGTWLGQGFTRLYGKFFSFPFLIFQSSPDLYVLAAGISLAAALIGAMKAIASVLALEPAIAMQPPPPSRYRHHVIEQFGLLRMFSRLTVMAIRHLVHRPLRAAATSFGIALAVALLVTALFATDSVNFMIDTIYFRSDRQHASLTFAEERPPSVMAAVGHLPGILMAEPYRSIPVMLRHGSLSRRLAITGKQAGATLSRVLDENFEPVVLPKNGLAISERVAAIFGLTHGQTVTVEVLSGRREVVEVRISAVIRNYLGLAVFMDLDALFCLAGEGPRVGGAHLAIDTWALGRLYSAVKNTPTIASVSLQTLSREKLRETVQRNIAIMTTLYVTLAIIIAFGVIYNSARIQFSERARELASLRVLGFTRGEVSRVLLIEMAVIVLIAQPLGWGLGAGFATLVGRGFESDLFQLPIVLEADTFAKVSLVVLAAAALSAFIIRRRVDRLDLIRVLKTRD